MLVAVRRAGARLGRPVGVRAAGQEHADLDAGKRFAAVVVVRFQHSEEWAPQRVLADPDISSGSTRNGIC